MGGGAGGGGGRGSVETIPTKAAKMQLTHRQNAIKGSALAKTPGIGSALAMAMGNLSLSSQQKALDEGGTAVAVPGTSWSPQGQAYTQAPGMISDPEIARKAGLPTASLGKFAVFKDSDEARSEIANKGLGYVGDVAGVSLTRQVFGKDVTTFTGKTGYSPTGERQQEPPGGGKDTTTPVVPEPEQEVVSPSEMLPGETPEQYRRRTRRLGGGSVLEGGGVLYK